MAVIALDIGTTKICAVAIDEESGAFLESRREDNSFLSAPRPEIRIQDPERIFKIAEGLVSYLVDKYRAVRCIGVTGQMHGILYLDASGRALSPLYTWQDSSSGELAENGETYADYLAKFSRSWIAPGYGIAAYYYHHRKNEIPPGAVKIAAIGDYAAARLCSLSAPVMHSTNAGGMGFFDLKSLSFDKKNIALAGLDPSMLPEVITGAEIAGKYRGSIPVAVSIGDNQASFLGSIDNPRDSILVNIGTGSQISFVTDNCFLTDCDNVSPGAMEARPFFDGAFLMTGAPLSGGRAYAMLEGFFRKVLEMTGFKAETSLYGAMDKAAETFLKTGAEQTESSLLKVNTAFAGTRANPMAKGSIINISEDNFTPGALILGFLSGAARELYDFYLPAKKQGINHGKLIGAGNGIRRNRHLKKILSQTFGMPLMIPAHEEEAAYGAALFALMSTGYFKNTAGAGRLVKYLEET